uniref:Peptidyl-prolyl cis-trans isomerase n=1 Tax=Anthurium amnicola TaxID=1678845 RepID=A0A1D1XR41_9ARAE
MGKIKPQALLQQSKKKKGPARISLSTIITCNLVIFVVVLSLYAAYRHWYKRSQLETNSQESEDFETIGGARRSMKLELTTYAILNTSKGPVTLELYKEAAPEVVDRFLDLCQKGHFKGTHFPRVIKNYVIQVGGSLQPGASEDWIKNRKSDSPLVMSTKHDAFLLATSKVDHDGKDFQLFITTVPIPNLSDRFIVFGRVIKGDDVVQEIEDVDTDENYQPNLPVGIDDINLKQDV